MLRPLVLLCLVTLALPATLCGQEPPAQLTQLDGLIGMWSGKGSAMRTTGLQRLRFARAGGTTAVDAPLPGQEEAHARVLAAAPDEIARVLAAVRAGGHERLDLIDVPKPGFRLYIAVHSTQRGRGAGGLRRHDLVTPEETAIQDVLNLSRAMTFKNAVSELAYGGAKACLHSSPIPPSSNAPTPWQRPARFPRARRASKSAGASCPAA